MATVYRGQTISAAVSELLARDHQQLFVDGAWSDAADTTTFQAENPADGSILTNLTAAGPKDADRAVLAATRALSGPWRDLAPAGRARVLLAVAEGIEAHRDELALLETLDNGKPIALARGDVDFAGEVFRYFAGAPERLGGVLAARRDGAHCFVRREPVGVCALIVAWNFPLLLVAWKLAPALAAGNTVVLKPAEQTSLTAIRLAEIISDAVMPGVVNVLTGDGTTGAALVAHPKVHKVSFTGSTAVGQQIMTQAARNTTRVTLELGGKSPHIVFADADLEAAIESVVAGAFGNSGQVCSAGSRLLVDQTVHDDFVAEVGKRAMALRVGDGMDPSTDIGPLISRPQRDRVASYLDLARRSGVNIAAGGRVLDGPGYFVEPTVMTDVPRSSPLAQEEIFGPVLTVTSFKSEQEAVASANDTRYGLAAGVWTSDISRAHRMSEELRAGTVWVNRYGVFDPTLPFGGFGDSGIGRDLGDASLDGFTELKTVHIGFRASADV